MGAGSCLWVSKIWNGAYQPKMSARLGQIRQSQPHLATAYCATPDIRRGYACRRHYQLLGVAVASQQQLKQPRNAIINRFVYFEDSDDAYSAYINHQLKESLPRSFF